LSAAITLWGYGLPSIEGLSRFGVNHSTGDADQERALASVESSAAAPIRPDEVGAELVARARLRARQRVAGSREALALALAATFLGAAGSAAAFLPVVRPFSLLAAALAVTAYALGSRVEFEVGNGFALPTELVLVPMLFTLPLRSVPLLIAAGMVLGQAPKLLTGRLALSHLPILIFNASYSLGPVLVLALVGAGPPTWSDAPIYLGALAAQLVFDAIPGAIWSRRGYGIGFGEHLRSMRTAAFVDAALAPIGLIVAIATIGRSWGVLLVLPLFGLLRVFSRERQVRIDHALELGHAYRGTAMLLGDVIEADDEYTGAHSRDVVELVLGVADKLELGPRERQRAEFAALLHDVGKVKIPPEIINKPGPLDKTERALMNTHTIVGQTMLERIGGLLGDVGGIVRSCHERWDGAGYPDGLAGETIPLEARIVCACDAWSAMTTDRPYRSALPADLALAELRACAGTHFDPRVVAALLAVLEA
jgi:HD-GYP domain-containing protein (c-di-GMP phosphodiesterase class II)